MRIFWLNSGLLPEACVACGYEPDTGCGWIGAMLDAVRCASSDVQFCVVSIDWRSCDVQIGNTRHVSIPASFTYSQIPHEIQQRYQELITEFKPDVIHVQGTEYFYGCMDTAVYCDVPVVVSIQGVLSGIWPHYPGGLTRREMFCAHLNPRFFLKGQTLFQEQTFWRECRAAQEAKILRQQRYFLGRTEWDRAWVQYFNPRARYFEVNENLRPPFYTVTRVPTQIRKHSIYCGASVSCALKGGHWLLRAIAALKSEFPDIQLRIAAAQKLLTPPNALHDRLYDQAYHRYLRQLITKLGVRDNIVALPNLTGDQVAEELRHAELFVSPSMCENSPNSLCESMLVGTPSIATFVGGVPSILKDGLEGKLVPSGDPAALAGAIRRWFFHPEEAEACVGPARATARKRHDSVANAKATLNVYRELARSGPERTGRHENSLLRTECE